MVADGPLACATAVGSPHHCPARSGEPGEEVARRRRTESPSSPVGAILRIRAREAGPRRSGVAVVRPRGSRPPRRSASDRSRAVRHRPRSRAELGTVAPAARSAGVVGRAAAGVAGDRRSEPGRSRPEKGATGRATEPPIRDARYASIARGLAGEGPPGGSDPVSAEPPGAPGSPRTQSGCRGNGLPSRGGPG